MKIKTDRKVHVNCDAGGIVTIAQYSESAKPARIRINRETGRALAAALTTQIDAYEGRHPNRRQTAERPSAQIVWTQTDEAALARDMRALADKLHDIAEIYESRNT